MTKQRIAPSLLKLFQEHPGTTIPLPTLTNLGYARSSVQRVMGVLVREDPAFKVVIQGQAWRYDPDASSADETKATPNPFQEVQNIQFETPKTTKDPDTIRIVGMMDNGHLVLKDHENKLWEASRL